MTDPTPADADRTDPDAAPPPADRMEAIQVADDRLESRYEARLGDRVLGIIDYELDADAGRIVLVHTEVRPDAEGMGVGSRLARGALEDIRARGLRVTVECEFVAAYLKRHPREFQDLVPR
jgi:uncharacterized protein